MRAYREIVMQEQRRIHPATVAILAISMAVFVNFALASDNAFIRSIAFVPMWAYVCFMWLTNERLNLSRIQKVLLVIGCAALHLLIIFGVSR